jgi:hypothetical protein
MVDKVVDGVTVLLLIAGAGGFTAVLFGVVFGS